MNIIKDTIQLLVNNRKPHIDLMKIRMESFKQDCHDFMSRKEVLKRINLFKLYILAIKTFNKDDYYSNPGILCAVLPSHTAQEIGNYIDDKYRGKFSIYSFIVYAIKHKRV